MKCKKLMVICLSLMWAGSAMAVVYEMPVTFGGYANRTETLTNFPVLVTLSNNVGGSGFNYANFISPGGWDLRFRDAGDTTNLNYEIETWNTNGASYVWVQVPLIVGDGTASILAKWGDASNSVQLACTTNGAVWDSGFRGVWHLKENGFNYADSTVNHYTGSAGTAPATTDGVIDGAQKFSPNQYIDVGSTVFGTYDYFTIAAWVRPTTAGANYAIERGCDGYGVGWSVLLSESVGVAPAASVVTTSGGIAGYTANGTTLGDSNRWDYLVGVWRPGAGGLQLYVNGILEGVNGTSTTTLRTSTVGLRLGLLNTTYYSGYLDEVQVSNMARSSNWVWACWLNQASNNIFNVYGPMQSLLAGAPTIANIGVANVQTTSVDLVGNLVTGDAPVTVVCYWGTNDGGRTASAWMTNNNLGVQSLGYMTNPVTGLAAGQVYSFRYYATNSVGGSWASGSTTFSTLGAPTVDNDGGAASVGQTSAQLQGTVLGGNPNPNVWIYWGTTDGGTTPGLWNRGALDLGSSSLGGFSTNVTGLLANQTCWYRCFASNSYGTAWAGSSTNFTTATPSLTINNIGLFEGAQGVTNTVTFIVTLSSTSAVDVSVSYASSNGTATVANNDYVATNGTLTIPAGSLTGSIPVQVVGDNVYEADEVFYVNLSNGVNVTLAGRQGACTITNDDFTFYVRGDGAGSDANGGGAWNDAWATLQKVMDSVPYNVPITANVQASTGAQTYAVCSRAIGYYVNGGPLRAFTVNFQGGWQNVDTTPVQTGMTVVQSAAANQDGIAVVSPDHNERATLTLNRFVITNVLNGISYSAGAGLNWSGCTLTVSNTTIHAKNYGVSLSYPVYYPTSTFGGPTKVIARNVDIAAGLGGVGDGIYSYGAWLGSSIGADGTNEVTGEARVSSITSSNGCGVNCVASVSGNGAHGILFSNVVIYGCSSNAIQLSAGAPDPVQALLRNCTIADNGGDGLGITGGAAGSWGNATNCIFANNGGHGINLGVVAGPAFVCSEGYNVFFNDDILTNGVVKTLAGSSSAADPLFWAKGLSPDPWYKISSRISPAYGTAAGGGMRGAYQVGLFDEGLLILIE